MSDFWNRLPLLSETTGEDITPNDLILLIDFCCGWRDLYDSQRAQGETQLASTTKARRALAVKLLAVAATARGLDGSAIARWNTDTCEAEREAERLRLKAWVELKATTPPRTGASMTGAQLRKHIREMAGVKAGPSEASVQNWARAAGVSPRQGKTDTYTEGEVASIVSHVATLDSVFGRGCRQ